MKQMILKHKIAVLGVAAVIALGWVGGVESEQASRASSVERQKLDALNGALKNGLITQDEYNAKLQTLNIPAAQSPARAAAPHSSGQMKTVEVIDPFFGQRAFTMTIPADWNFEGTVFRGRNGAGPELVYRASSPDGLTGVQRLPRYDWEWSDDPAYQRALQTSQTKAMKPMPAGEFVKQVVLPDARPRAQASAIQPIPDLSEKLAEQDRHRNEMLANLAATAHMPASHLTSNAERVRIQYDFGGHAEEEWIAAVTSTQDFPSMPSRVRSMRAFPAHSICQAWVTGARAPKGQLDASDNRLIAIIRSASPDPAWQQKEDAFVLKQTQIQMAQAQQQGQALQAQIMRQSQAALANQRAIFDRSMNSARAMSEAGHQSAMATAEHMGDVQPMVDPVTGRTGQVSNQYNYSYANGDGSVVQTNSPTSNPNAQLRGNWTRLQPTNPQ